MMKLMESLEYVWAYIDDLLCISRESFEDHLEKLEEVLKQLHDAGLKVNADKLAFRALEIEYREFNRFWGHVFGQITQLWPR